jgi:hypothetical protein
MARLPTPGADEDNWGTILNDYLSQSHNTDGSLKTAAVSDSGGAVDSDVVHNTTAETISGVKTFNSSPVVPTPASSNQAANKSYVNSTVAAGAPDATASGKGIIQLAGDLAGSGSTATAPVITDDAITTGKLLNAAVTSAKIANSTIVDANVSAISESKITNLTTDLAAKAPTTRLITAGTGLTGGGDLSADRTLAVSYGVIAGTVAQGNDTRITGAIPSSTATTKGDLLAATAASTVTRQAVGGDGQVLTADSAQSTGIKWATPIALDSTTTDIQATGVQAAGATGKAADAGHVHPIHGWIPSDNGLLASTAPPELATSASGAMTAGNVYIVKIPIRLGLTATTMWYRVSNAGSGASSGSFVGLYSSSGSLLSSTADVGANLIATGVYSTALGSPQALTAGTFIWVALVQNLATTQAQLNSFGGASSTLMNVNLTRAFFRAGQLSATGQTSLPASFTPASGINSSTSAGIPIWFGIS